MSAAPLKQGIARPSYSASTASPHSHECGPVEAGIPRGVDAGNQLGLRTLMSAAPLKPVIEPKDWVSVPEVSALS